jgi:CubicO group peptidase (beta-lactamase class C family)
MKRTSFLASAALAALLLGGAQAPPAAAQTAPAAAARTASNFPADADLQVMLDYLVADRATPGIILGIVEPDGSTRILQQGTAGEGARPLGPRTVFEIGSINKTFTGTLLAHMVLRGEVALDDPVQKYLPESVRVPSRNGRQITLLDLATHRSALPRLPNNHRPADRANPYADYTVETMYAFLSGHELRRDIGAEFEYSNLGLGLLGHALSRAGGQPLPDLIRARITEPLGMRNTGYARDGDMGAMHARGHGEAGAVVSYWDASEAIAGAGGMRSTMEDMLIYLRAQLSPPDNELGRAIRLTHQVHQRYPEFNAGITWPIRTREGRTVVSHTGGTGGFSTAIGLDPERRTGFVMLTNTTGFDDDLGTDFMYRGGPLALPEVRVARDVLARYAGTYTREPRGSAVVRLEDDGTMTLRAGGNVRFRMYADSDSTFFLKRAPWRIRFTRDASGAVSGFVLDAGGEQQTWSRASDATTTPSAGTAPAAAPAAPPAPPAATPAAPAAPGSGAVTLAAEERARYVGTYLLSADGRQLELKIFDQGGQLMGEPAGQTPSPLRPQGNHVFIPELDDDLRLVFTVQDGRATSVTLHQGGREIPGPRVP